MRPLSAVAPLPDVLLVAAVDDASKMVSGEAVVVVVVLVVVGVVMLVGAIVDAPALLDMMSLDVVEVILQLPLVCTLLYSTRTST